MTDETFIELVEKMESTIEYVKSNWDNGIAKNNYIRAMWTASRMVKDAAGMERPSISEEG